MIYASERVSTPRVSTYLHHIHSTILFVSIRSICHPLFIIGSYYAYDIPSALHQQLQDYMPPSSQYETQFNLLYTVYSIPNVVLPLFVSRELSLLLLVHLDDINFTHRFPYRGMHSIHLLGTIITLRVLVLTIH